jgi:release factor glutamine methyltransferase
VPSAALAAELLLMHVLGRDRTWLYAHPEHALTADALARYDEMIERRAQGVPVQYLTGRQEFWGLGSRSIPAC